MKKPRTTPVWRERRRKQKAASAPRYKAKKADSDKRWAQANRDKTRANQRRFYWRHSEAEKLRSRLRSPEKRSEINDRYRRRNLAKFAAKENKRRAIKAATQIGQVDYDRVVREADGVCGICKAEIAHDDKTHIDHIVPLARGGSHTQDNIQLAHARCNIKKGARAEMAEVPYSGPKSWPENRGKLGGDRQDEA